MRPAHSDFEDCGAVAALVRLFKSAGGFELPSWVLEPRLDRVLGSEAEMGVEGSSDLVKEARELAPRLAQLEEQICGGSKGGSSGADSAKHVVVMCRLLLGAVCEAHASKQAQSIATPGCRNNSLGKNMLLRQLYKDASLAAVWTSAHAQYLHDLRTNGGMAFCLPTIHTLPCEASELDLSDLYARRMCPSEQKFTVPASRSRDPRKVCWSNLTPRAHPARPCKHGQSTSSS